MPRRRLRLGIAIALSALGVLGALVYAFRAAVIYRPLGREIAAKVAEELGGRAEIGSVSGSLATTLRLSRGTLTGIGGLPEGSRITFDDARARYSLLALARHERDWLAEVEIVRPRIEIDLSKPIAPRPKTPPAAGAKRTAPPIPRALLRDGTVVLRTRGGRTVTLEGIELRLEPLGGARVAARIATRSLPYAVAASADLARFPEGEVAGTLAVSGAGSLDARLVLAFGGRGAVEGEARATALDLAPAAALALGAPFPGGAPLDFEASAARGAWRLDRLSLGARGSLVSAQGLRASDGAVVGRLDLAIADLADLADLVGKPFRGALEAHADVSGRARDLASVEGSLALALDARGLAAGGRPIPLDSLTVEARVSRREVEISRLVARADPAVLWANGTLALEPARVFRGEANVSVAEIEQVVARLGLPVGGVATPWGKVDASVRVDEAPLASLLDAKGGAWLSVRGARLGRTEISSIHAVLEAGGRAAALEELSVATKSDVSAVSLQAHAQMREDGSAVAAIDSLATVVAGKRVAPPFLARVERDPTGALLAVLSLPRIDLATVGAILPGSPRLLGRVSLFAIGGGPPGALDGAARIEARDVAGYGVAVPRIEIAAAANAARARLERLLVDRAEGGTLTAEGEVAFATREGDLLLEAHELDLAPASAFIPNVRGIAGRVNARLTASGALQAPRLAGFLDLKKGAVHFERLLATYYAVDAHVDLDGGRATLSKVVLHAGGGEASASGEATFAGLRPTSFSLSVKAKDFLALAGESARLRADADLRFFGEPAAMKLEGGLHIADFRWYRDVGVFKRRPSAGQSATAGSGFLRALSLDVALSSEPEVWVDDREALVRGRVSAHVTGGAADPRIDGTVQAVEGRATIYFRTFRIERATVSFVDGRLAEPWIDLAAKARASGVEIFVTVRGEARNPEIRFSSTPPLPESDIVSLLTIGTTRGGAQEAGAGSVAASTAGRYLFSRVLEKFRGRNRDIGLLERITVEADANRPGTTSPSLQAAEASGPRFTVILDVSDSWRTQAERDRYGFYNFDVFYQWRFR